MGSKKSLCFLVLLLLLFTEMPLLLTASYDCHAYVLKRTLLCKNRECNAFCLRKRKEYKRGACTLFFPVALCACCNFLL
ncbi:hypothetical protein HPP92_001770 [Vanilla planifolia]|uniref:Uncharacterized protein n=1 Tax=Vanilla planifolia TaxID=51239 RepID=A0A835VDV6_VANPL|nr:hypothetical protein HPP92_001770 [Vanilla planifolia]